MESAVKSIRISPFSAVLAAAVLCLASAHIQAQNLTLEGQTGGFVTPTAYVVPVDKGHVFSHPTVGYYFINANKVIGDIHTFSLIEGFGNRAEVGYTRSVHQTGNSPELSELWHFAGMNVFNGKVVVLKDGQGFPLIPGIAAGFVVRTGDKFVSGAIDGLLGQPVKSYTNGDVYAVATKTWAHAPLPFIANFGFKGTNASILGIGGQATRFQGRFFGGLGIPIPFLFHTAIIPAAGFLQEPPHSVNLNEVLVVHEGRLPTTVDYAVRFTQRKNSHFSAGIGIGQVAGMIGETYIAPPNGPGPVPVNLQARSVLGINLGFRY
jgi:hypothetical protein